jgi:ABC-type amino acid transport substrate-binding protein
MDNQRCRRVALALLAGVAMVLGRAPASAADPITLYYYERPPYSVTAENGTVSGLLIEPTRAAFKGAGVPFRLELASITRILDLIRDEQHGPACSGGWFKTEERARYAKFTKPFYRETTAIGIAAKSLAVPPGTRVADLLAGPATLVVIDGYSYGRYLDSLIQQKDPKQILRLTRPDRTMFDMVISGHADLVLTNEDDAAAAATLGVGGPDYPILHFPDIPQGDTRYIMCSRSVPDEVIDRLNQAIDFR